MKYLTILLLLIITTPAQQEIEIIKETGNKRLKFYAQNHTEDDYELFFMVQSEGFRRSSDRPLIKKIPAGRKVYLMQMIPLKDADTSYNIISNYQKELPDLKFRKTDTLDIEIRRVSFDTIN